MNRVGSPYFGAQCQKVQRTQRYPQYSDHEMSPFFAEVAKGYCWKQASERAKMVPKWVNNTLYSDDDRMELLLDLAIAAGEKIRSGLVPVPDRYDGLYR